MFAIIAVAAAGLPPFGGFLGKAMLLSAGLDTWLRASVWTVVLVSGLAMVVAVARAGSTLFWESSDDPTAAGQATTTTGQRGAIALVIAGTLTCAVLAGPLAGYTHDAAVQLFNRTQYVEAVLQTTSETPLWNIREGLAK